MKTTLLCFLFHSHFRLNPELCDYSAGAHLMIYPWYPISGNKFEKLQNGIFAASFIYITIKKSPRLLILLFHLNSTVIYIPDDFKKLIFVKIFSILQTLKIFRHHHWCLCKTFRKMRSLETVISWFRTLVQSAPRMDTVHWVLPNAFPVFL